MGKVNLTKQQHQHPYFTQKYTLCKGLEFVNKYANLPSFCLFSFLIRLLITGASIGDALVIIAFSTIYAGYCYLEHKKEAPVNKDVKDRLCDLEEQVKTTKDKMNSLALGAGLRK